MSLSVTRHSDPGHRSGPDRRVGEGTTPVKPDVSATELPLSTAQLGAALGEITDGYLEPQTESLIGRAYLVLLPQESPTRDHLVHAGFPEHVVDGLLAVLVRRRLIDLAIDGQISVREPATALPEFALRLQREAASLLAATNDLARIYRDRDRDKAPDTGHAWLRLLGTVEEIGAAVAEAVGEGRETVLAMRAPTLRIMRIAALRPEEAGRPLTNHRGFPLTSRVLYDSRLISVPRATEVLRHRAVHETQRALPDLPMTITVVDDDVAVIDVSFPGRAGAVGAMVRSRAVVGPLRAMVERIWALAPPVPVALRGSGLDDRDLRILGMLGSGATDAMIARHTGVSQRTVERRIRSIMDVLGGETRFQAGMLAKERGWL